MIFYNISIRFYQLLIFIFSFFNKKANLFYSGRKNWRLNFSTQLNGIKNPIWVHCSSLGEFEQGRPVIEWIKANYPNQKIIVTFFSPSGFEIQKKYKHADAVIYLPIDTPKNAIDFLNLVNPSLTIFIKYEFWLNYLFQLQAKQIPTFIISAKFRANQIFFKWYGKNFLQALGCFNHIFVQDEASKKILQAAKINHVTVANDTRFDRVFQNSTHVEVAKCITDFCDDKKIIIVGSSWQADEEILIKWQKNNLPNDWKMIWVPHEIEISKIKNLQSKLNAPTLLFTEIINADVKTVEAKHLIINTIGMLSKVYSKAHVAYIGGGFGSGIHNILEPAVYGMPIIFGPKYHKFNEAFDLINEGSGFSIQNEEQLTVVLNKIISNKLDIDKLASISKNYVEHNLGGTKSITDYLIQHNYLQ